VAAAVVSERRVRAVAMLRVSSRSFMSAMRVKNREERQCKRNRNEERREEWIRGMA